MNKIYLFLVAITLCIAVTAQPSLVWAKALSGTAGGGWGQDVATDASGNVYSTGTFTGTVDFDPGAGTYTMSAFSEDFYITKLDAQGNFVWAKRVGGNADERSYGIATDAAGNSYITGTFYTNVDFDPGPGVNGLSVSSNLYSTFILKLDVNGDFVWARALSGDPSGNVLVADITVDLSGNVYTTGRYNGGADFDPGTGTYTLTNASPGVSTYDIFICKLDANGNFSWARKVGDTADDYGNGITTDASGNVFVAGTYSLSPDFDPGAGVTTLTSAGQTDAFICKLNSSGNLVWAKSIGGTQAEGAAFVKLDPSGNVYSGGNYVSTNCDFDPGPGVVMLPTSTGGNSQIYISKLDANGGYLWAKGIYGSNKNCTGGAVDASGNVYLTGYFALTCTFDLGISNYTLTAGGTLVDYNIFISRYNANGNFAWAVSTGASGVTNEYSYAMCLGPNNAVYYTGSFAATSNFDPGAGTYTIAPPNGRTPYVSMLCQGAPPLSAIQGSTLICAGTSATYTTAVTGASSYSWALPTGWSGTSSINTINLTAGTGTVNISVLAINACGTGTSNLTVFTSPSPTIGINSGSICAGRSFTLLPSGAISYTISGSNAVVSPVNTTTYAVIGSNATGCVSGATSTVTVNALPVISVNSGSVCTGSSFTLSPAGAATYTISGGNSVVSPAANSSYTVTGTSSQGCVSAAAAIASVAVNALPVINAAVTTATICSGETTSLSATGATAYAWSDNQTGAGISITPTINTTYTVVGTAVNGCVNKTTVTQNVDACTGIAKQNKAELVFAVYPNPNTGEFVIETPGNVDVTVLNNLGQVVHTERTAGVKTPVNISHLSNGIYFVKAVSQGNQQIVKIIKQ